MDAQLIDNNLRDVDIADQKIFDLLKKRASLAAQVGQLKQQEKSIIYRPEREIKILKNVIGMNDSLLQDSDLVRIFYEIINSCRAIQKKIKLSYFEDNELLRKVIKVQFGQTVDVFLEETIDKTDFEFSCKETEYFVISIDFLKKSINYFLERALDFFICQEIEIFTKNSKNLTKENTRFLVLGRQKTSSTGSDKTSLILEIPDCSGSLYNYLSVFHNYKINLELISSCACLSAERTSVFLIEIEGHRDDQLVRLIFSELLIISAKITVLGSYPRAVLPIKI